MVDLTKKRYGEELIGEEIIKALLADDKIDGSGGVLYYENNVDAAIPPNEQDITILIGLGGTGVQTLDYIKKKIRSKLHFSWSHRIAFLAIDADWNEVSFATSLDADEGITLGHKDDSLQDKVKDETKWPKAWRHIANKEMIKSLSAYELDKPGSCGRRLVGKLRIHNKMSTAQKGYDEKIIDRLRHIVAGDASVDPVKRLHKPGEFGKYRVYVIGSGSGGTCSGGFLEMPALIREAIGSHNNLWTCGMLYLPDTLERKPGMKEEDKDRIKAVGFATLKELDHYMGIPMRENPEFFACNAPGANKRYHLQMNGNSNFFDTVFLVGTNNGAATESNKIAKETIAEYLISMLAKYTIKNASGIFLAESADSNGAGQENRERAPDARGRAHIPSVSESHNVPKVYSAVGFASAAAPIKIVRAYTVSKACQKAKLRSVDRRGAGGSNELEPYLSKNYKLPALEGTKLAEDLFKPFEVKLTNSLRYAKCDFDNLESCGSTGTLDTSWESLHCEKPTYKSDKFIRVKKEIVDSQTDVDAIKQMRAEADKAFVEFKNKVKAYVIEYGPFSFVNIYDGNFMPDGNNAGIGIGKMLQNIVDGFQPNGTPYKTEDKNTLDKKLTDAKTAISDAKDGLIIKAIHGAAKAFGSSGIIDHNGLIDAWKNAESVIVEHEIIEKRVPHLVGKDSILNEHFKVKADELRDQIEMFGKIIDAMCDIYDRHGSPMESPKEFANACDNACEVNLAADAHGWIMAQVEEQLTQFNASQARNELVTNFFQNTKQWLEIPDDRIEVSDRTMSLKNENLAIPAREHFERFMKSKIQFSFDLSIKALLTRSGDNIATVSAEMTKMVKDLIRKSEPLFNGPMQIENYYRSIMYPTALASVRVGGQDGTTTTMEALLLQAVSQEDKSIHSNASSDTDSIRMIQTVGYLEQYRLNEMPDWEQCYESFLGEQYGYHMHAYSPCKELGTESIEIAYNEPIAWQDYPAPTVHPFDPKYTKDEMDKSRLKLEREGKRQLEILALVKKAKALGILYATEQTQGTETGWYIQMADADVSWKLDMNGTTRNKDGFYPEGKELLAVIAGQNYHRPDKPDERVPDGNALQAISRRVYLKRSDLTTKLAEDEELAWEFAEHSMYARCDMVIRLRKLIPWFEEQSKTVREANDLIRASLKAAMFPALIVTGKICDEGDRWTALVDESKILVLNTDPFVLSVRPDSQRVNLMLENKMRYAFAFKEIMKHENMTSDRYQALFGQAKADYLEQLNKLTKGEQDAKQEFKQMMERLVQLEEEIAHVKKLGAAFPDGGSVTSQATCNSAFKSKLKELGIADADEIYNFYRLAERWKTMLQ